MNGLTILRRFTKTFVAVMCGILLAKTYITVEAGQADLTVIWLVGAIVLYIMAFSWADDL